MEVVYLFAYSHYQTTSCSSRDQSQSLPLSASSRFAVLKLSLGQVLASFPILLSISQPNVTSIRPTCLSMVSMAALEERVVDMFSRQFNRNVFCRRTPEEAGGELPRLDLRGMHGVVPGVAVGGLEGVSSTLAASLETDFTRTFFLCLSLSGLVT